jgi:hypothetical protein
MNEFDKLRIKQEAERAADLKAKLEMVETKPKPKYGRAPKKIGEVVCNTGIKNGWRAATASFVLRLDGGEFIAEYGDVWYVSKSRDALQAKMDQVAKVTFDLKWTRYLRVDYRTEVPYRDNWHSTTTIDIDSPRDEDTVVLGIKLSWETVEYSDQIDLPGQGPRFMKRDVVDDGVTSSSQETVNKLPDGLVPYTKEREGVLLRLRAALNSVDAKMIELFRGEPGRVARALDNVGTGALLLEGSKSTANLKPAVKKAKR